jgi:outer membrane immunogenic protein
MRSLSYALLAGSALSLGMAQIGVAADMPVKAPYVAPPAIYDWSGFYFGGHIGEGWGHKTWHDTEGFSFDGLVPFGFDPTKGAHNVSGPLGGLQGGYNWQSGRWVVGIDGTYSFSNLKGQDTSSSTATFAFLTNGGANAVFGNATLAEGLQTKVTGIATIAGKLGYMSDAIDRTLFYVKGGAAYARDKYTLTQQASVNAIVTDPGGGLDAAITANASATQTGSASRWGPMFGTGVELALDKGWSAFIEYDYLALGHKNVKTKGTGNINGAVIVNGEGAAFIPFDASGPVNTTLRIGQDIQLIKFGLNYHFATGGKGPVVANY